ncbi:hypothetical protein BJ508DRAFT_419459 [Ascobolus immersus RN42]|uniref:Uncharacterized protein n=1 Tax=Ascobolus immersus RN42 TaxID=1160509 RepID=A0A3N4HS20_ASCIM|nr:hypothetical protein BJ508DRAFT_419459 [Ascobolus immersus RN42]
MAPIESSIKTSSDAWATLVANIAPLLVLVGEKHVKEYFKTMSKASHQILFAAGPIGLVTAVTTLIRIKGSAPLKRLIGRSFETRAEMFADVTGLSSGEVAFELKNGRLEQTTDPSDEDLALFFFHGRQEGTVGEAMAYWKKAQNATMRSGKEWPRDGKKSVMIRDHAHMVLGCCVRVEGENAQKLLHKSVEGWDTAEEGPGLFGIFERLTQYESVNVKALVYSYGSVSGFSLGLTANECVDGGLRNVLRLVAAAFSLSANIGLIVANWFMQKDKENTAMIAVGTAISVLGSYIVATVVKMQTVLYRLPLDGLHLFRSGFHSRRIPTKGLELSFIPSCAISSDTDEPLENENDQKDDSGWQSTKEWASNLVIASMVAGYVVLYLGLRTAEWWVCLSILGIAALSSVARAILAPDLLKVSKPLAGHYLTNPFIILGLLDSRTKSESAPFRFTNQLSLQPPTTVQSQPIDADQLSEPQDGKSPTKPQEVELLDMSGPYESQSTPLTHEFIFYSTSIVNTGSPQSLNAVSRGMLGSALSILLQTRNLGLVPLELNPQASTRQIRIANPGTQEPQFWEAHMLYSDWITPIGVMRQPLELLVSSLDESFMFNEADNEMYSLTVPYKLWLWRSTADEHRKELIGARGDDKSAWISRKPVSSFLDSGSDHLKWPQKSELVVHDNLTALWMLVKICAVVFRDWNDERIKNRFEADLKPSVHNRYGTNETLGGIRADSYEVFDFVIKAMTGYGLLVPSSSTSEELEEAPVPGNVASS